MPVGTKWAKRDDMDSLMVALDFAETVAHNPDATQEAVDAAQERLAAVMSTFKTADGTKRPVYTDCGFNDVKAEIAQFGAENVWYVADGWLDFVVSAGLMAGYADGSGNFGPYDSITRGQAAVILHRAATGIAPGEADDDVYAGFSDVDLAPREDAWRASMAKMITVVLRMLQ